MRKLHQEWAVLHAKYPLLLPPILENNIFVIRGVLPVIDGNGTHWDSFDVQIDIERDYPLSLPSITETGKRIFRSEDWHINKDGTCCVGTPAEQFRKLHGRMTLLNWVDAFAVPFFANYIYRKDKGRYFNGQWSHGIKGIYEDYATLYDLPNLALLLQRLRYCSDRERLSHNALCFCNSGKRYKRCYLLQQEAHRFNIPKMIIWKDVSRLQQLQRFI